MTLIGVLSRKVNRLNVLPNMTLPIVAFPTNRADVRTMFFLDATRNDRMELKKSKHTYNTVSLRFMIFGLVVEITIFPVAGLAANLALVIELTGKVDRLNMLLNVEFL